MAYRKTAPQSNLAEYLVQAFESNGLRFNQPKQIRFLTELATELAETFGTKAQANWPDYQNVFTKILEWLEQNNTPELPWRDEVIRQTEALQTLTRLAVNRASFSDPVKFFETQVKPLLESRRNELLERAGELWELEGLIRYGVERTLQEQFYGVGLDASEIDLAFSEKLDTILLTYDPTLAGHASLKTYAIFLIYRHLLDKIRRLGYTQASRAAQSDETEKELNRLEADFKRANEPINYNLAVEGVAVCRIFLQEVENSDESGNFLSTTRRQLIYFNLLNTMLNESIEPTLNLEQIASLLINIASFVPDSSGFKLLSLVSAENATLQMLSNKLQLKPETNPNRVQLSQARRILANRSVVKSAVARFVDYAPYQAKYKEQVKQNPIKIVDYCFNSLERFDKLIKRK